jgi:hypothetical protein
MTLLLTSCIAFAIMRILEQVALFLYGIFSRLTIKRKPEAIKERSWMRLSANVSPELHNMIKAHAQLMGLTITDYILIAINEKLKRSNHGLQ